MTSVRTTRRILQLTATRGGIASAAANVLDLTSRPSRRRVWELPASKVPPSCFLIGRYFHTTPCRTRPMIETAPSHVERSACQNHSNRSSPASISMHKQCSHSGTDTHNTTVPSKHVGGSPSVLSLAFWSSRHTWHRSAVNTARCLVGCTLGDFSALWYMQSAYPDLGMGVIMPVASKC